MKQKQQKRKYLFTDAKLVFHVKEKAAYMTRDIKLFKEYGIDMTKVDDLKSAAGAFADMVTDKEAIADIAVAKELKMKKRGELQVALKSVMIRVGQVFGSGSTEYHAYDTKGLTKKTDAKFLFTAKLVAANARLDIKELAVAGLTVAMLDNIEALAESFENLVLDLKDAISNRAIMRESRVTAGNALYTALMMYAKIGRNIWETTSVSKYRDYVVYKGRE